MLPKQYFNMGDWINCGFCDKQFEIHQVFHRDLGYCSRCRKDMPAPDLELICAAEGAIAGYGDGRISRRDIQDIMDIIHNTGWYSLVEKSTLEHIYENYRFTKLAEQIYHNELEKWPKTSKKK
tara:strand:+ start:55 stop:423 length:369 start_codon:yes stop_codon:yes gene_type:complete